MLGLLWLYVAQPAYADTIYIVQPGDNLYRISLRYSVSQPALMAANSLTDPSRIYVGERLVIPGRGTQPATASAEPGAAPVPAIVTPPATESPTPVAPASGTYVVQRGDSLWSLAQRFGVSVADIQRENHLSSGWLYSGQVLVLPGSGPTAVPLPTVAALPAGDASRPAWLPPWIPAISARMRQIYAQSSRQGHNPRIFAVAGDCNSDYPVYLGPVGVHLVDLSAYPYLDATASHFSASFLRHSVATQGGFNAGSMMDPTWADPAQCLGGEGPLACELRVSHASIVFIAVGTGNQFTWRDFEVHYRALIDYTLGHGVLPVLVTKADTLESLEGGAEPGYINSVIRRLGQEYGVPVLDFSLAVRDLPNGGLLPNGGHDFHLNAAGIGRHILATLQTLYVVLHP